MKNCIADLTPNPSPCQGEGSAATIIAPLTKVIVSSSEGCTHAVAPSPYQGEGWGGVCKMYNLESISRR
jgi:hypothetical protein